MVFNTRYFILQGARECQYYLEENGRIRRERERWYSLPCHASTGTFSDPISKQKASVRKEKNIEITRERITMINNLNDVFPLSIQERPCRRGEVILNYARKSLYISSATQFSRMYIQSVDITAYVCKCQLTVYIYFLILTTTVKTQERHNDKYRFVSFFM